MEIKENKIRSYEYRDGHVRVTESKPLSENCPPFPGRLSIEDLRKLPFGTRLIKHDPGGTSEFLLLSICDHTCTFKYRRINFKYTEYSINEASWADYGLTPYENGWNPTNYVCKPVKTRS